MSSPIATHHQLPPGPEMPAWRVSQAWLDRPIEFWEECAGEFGETFTITLGSIGPTVLFSRPEAVREIFGLPPTSYECRPYNDYYRHVMGNRAVLVVDGADHRREKRLMISGLTRRMVEPRFDLVDSFVADATNAWPTDRALSPRFDIHVIALRIILSVFFGSADDPFAAELVQLFRDEVFKGIGSRSPWTRFVHHHQELRDRIAAEVTRRRQSPHSGSTALFDVLASQRLDTGEFLDMEEIQDHVFTILIAGVDPASLAIAWALYWIHENPPVLAKVHEELAALGPAPDPGLVVELPYLRAVCQETLRMYPVVATPTGRKLLVDTVIGGRIYPAGTTLLPCTHLVHRRAELYPDPDRFLPERFLDRTFAAHEYFPFGGGARTCIGASAAPLEMRLVLASILRRCNLTPAHSGPVRPMRHGTLIAPSDAYFFLSTARVLFPQHPNKMP